MNDKIKIEFTHADLKMLYELTEMGVSESSEVAEEEYGCILLNKLQRALSTLDENSESIQSSSE